MFTWPDWFPLSLPGERIETKRWRGIAMLNRRRGAAGIEDSIDPLSGTRFTDRDVALHQIPKPQKVATQSGTAAGTVLLAANPGVRYLINGFNIAARNIVTDTNTGVYFRGTFDGTVVTVAFVTVLPSAVNVNQTTASGIAIICDVNTAVTAYAATDVFSLASVAVYYTEIGGAP